MIETLEVHMIQGNWKIWTSTPIPKYQNFVGLHAFCKDSLPSEIKRQVLSASRLLRFSQKSRSSDALPLSVACNKLKAWYHLSTLKIQSNFDLFFACFTLSLPHLKINPTQGETLYSMKTPCAKYLCRRMVSKRLTQLTPVASNKIS